MQGVRNLPPLAPGFGITLFKIKSGTLFIRLGLESILNLKHFPGDQIKPNDGIVLSNAFYILTRILLAYIMYWLKRW